MGFRHFSDSEVLQILTPEVARKALLDAFLLWSEGKASTMQRARCVAGIQMCSSMIAVVPPFSGGKIYSTNGGKFSFLVVLFDANGQLLATFDGDMLTRLRTSALIGAAVERLHPTTPEQLGIIGAGKQSQMIVLEVLRTNPTLQGVSVFDLNDGASQQLVEELQRRGVSARLGGSPLAVAQNSDTIITVTSSKEPVLDHHGPKPGTLIVGVGATKDGLCELAPSLIAASSEVVCDDVEGSRIECGDLLEASRVGLFDWQRAIELKNVLGGRVSPKRGIDEIVIFETQGVAIQDVAAAAAVWTNSQI